jgi:hypothetical protein
MGTIRVLCTLTLALLVIGLVGCGDLPLPDFIIPQPSATATVELAAFPTPTPQQMPTPSASPSPVPFPPQPGDFNKYAKAIIGYLNASQGDVDGLREMLEAWGALRHVTHLLRVDVDDDGQGEFVMTLVDPTVEYVTEIPGDLLVIDIDGEEYRLSYQAATDRVISDPALLEVDDVNGDGHTELAFSSTACGAHTCTTTVYIVGSGLGTYDDLVNGGIEMTFAEVNLTDWDGDSVSELVMYGGIIGSVGAGPQRARTEVYKWDGLTYTLVETIYDPSNYMYFKVLDANQALLDGDYAAAAELYQQAIENPNLEAWMGEYEREDLTAFSRYRLALTYLLIDNTDGAKAARDEVLREQPDHIYAQVVVALWDGYLTEGDLRSACDEVATFASEHPETADVLANYGYGNPTFTAEEVCPTSLF